MKRLAVLTITLITFVVASNLVPPPSHAERPINTVTVEPASLNFDMSGSTDKKVSTVTIHNDYTSDIRMLAEFKGIDETGGKIVPNGDPSQVILNTLKLSATEFIVPAHGVYYLTVLATDNGSLSPGGHYATLVLSNQNTKPAQSSVQSEVSLGIFIVKRDGLISNVVLTDHILDRKYFAFPKALSVELLNDGNAHITPRGSAQITDNKNTVIAEGVFNPDSKIILPGKRFNQQLQFSKNNSLLPKRLKLEIRYRADGIDEPKVYQKYFWYIPSFYLYLVIFLVILVTFLIIWRRQKPDIRHKSKIVAKST